MRRTGIVLVLAVLSAGCASTPSLTRPNNDLDRALRYQEVSRTGKSFAVSESTSSKFLGVPNGWEVDTNSTIELEIRKDEVRLPQGVISQEEKTAFVSKTTKLKQTLEALDAVVQARNSTLVAYQATVGLEASALPGSREYSAFIDARRISGKFEKDFADLPIWTDGTLGLSEEEIDKTFEDPTYKAVGRLLQTQLTAVETAFQDAESKIKRNAPKLLLRAVIEPQKGDPTAIHLPNYDNIDQREVKFRDSPLMDREDWEAFRQRYTQTVGLAKEAERIRQGESTLRESLSQLGLTQLESLAATAEQIELLTREDWPTLRDKLGQELTFAGKAVKEVAEKHGQMELATYAAAIEDARKRISAAPAVVEVNDIIVQIKDLRRTWQKITPETLPDTLEKTKALADRAPKVLSGVAKFDDVRAAVHAVVAPLENRPKEIPTEIWADLQAKLADPKALQRTKSLLSAATALKRLADDIKATLDFASVQPSMTDLRIAQGTEISWADAPNTRVELPRSPRATDDRIHVMATLKVGDADYMQSHAVFSVQQFGRHSILAPSVVLAKPMTNQSSFDKSFKFAPAVAWLQTYHPRPADSGPLNAFFRFSQAGIGLHAVFLDMDPNKEAEIGLGAATSFWKDRIVAGVGWNLMANSRAYFYIGSNLIPILQALGYGKEGASGKQP